MGKQSANKKITGRSGGAEVLRSREQLRLVLAAAGAAVWEMDNKQRRELVAPGTHELMFGDLPDDPDISWEWWVERIHPDERAAIVDSLHQALEGDDERWAVDYRFCVANQSYHWFSDIAMITRDSAGVWQRVTGAMIDINQRRMAAILSHTGDAMIVFDANGVVTDFNLTAERMFGYPTLEVMGTPVLQLISQRQREVYRDMAQAEHPFREIKRAMRQQQILGQRKDGTVFPAEVRLSSVIGLDLTVCMVHDLSECIELQSKVGEIASWEQESIGRELHDNLGQRLTGLRMLAMHLQSQSLGFSEPHAKMLEDIVEQLKEAASEVTRISRGLAPISVAPEGLSDALATLIERADCSTTVHCCFRTESGINVQDHAIAHQVYRIAQEALNNALKYAQSSNITVTLSRDEAQVNLRVEDDGVGFDLAGMSQRLGLGLRIMRYRANTIGARLNIESTPGEGTCITCCFPTSAFS